MEKVFAAFGILLSVGPRGRVLSGGPAASVRETWGCNIWPSVPSGAQQWTNQLCDVVKKIEKRLGQDNCLKWRARGARIEKEAKLREPAQRKLTHLAGH